MVSSNKPKKNAKSPWLPKVPPFPIPVTDQTTLPPPPLHRCGRLLGSMKKSGAALRLALVTGPGAGLETGLETGFGARGETPPCLTSGGETGRWRRVTVLEPGAADKRPLRRRSASARAATSDLVAAMEAERGFTESDGRLAGGRET